MKKTRKVIAIIMCSVIALSLFAISLSVTANYTVLNKSFVSSQLITEDLVEKCTEQLKLKFKVLEKKSNIPAKVFRQALDDKPVDQIMKRNVENFFEGLDSTSNSEDVVDYFYEICIDYLENNNKVYSERDIKNVAVQAAKLYSDSVGFNNVEHLKLYIDELKADLINYISYALGFLIVASVLLYSMYSNHKKAIKYLAQSVIATGVSGIFVSIISKIMGYGYGLPISPEIYMQSVDVLVEHAFFVFVAVNIVIIAIGILVVKIVDKKISEDKHRRESRFDKKIDVL